MVLGCLCVGVLITEGVKASSSEGSVPAHELVFLDLDDNRKTLDDFRGKVLLINFWASWCPPCISEMPALKRLSQSMSNEPFALLAVNVAEGLGTVQRFASLEEAGISLLRDVNGDLAKHWGVIVYPTSIIIDGNGRRHTTIVGETDWDAAARYDQLQTLIRATATETTH
jgi:thiol-disulfide isomerase/thioredoxin